MPNLPNQPPKNINLIFKIFNRFCSPLPQESVPLKKDPVSDCATRVDRSLVRFDVSKVGRSVGLGESAKNCGGPVISQNSTFPFYSLCRIFRMHYNTCHFVEMLLR